MQLCSRCHKRMPVIFVSRFENGKMENQGLCIKCARELGISQVDAAIEQMGLSEEDVDRMNAELDQDELDELPSPDGDEPDGDGDGSDSGGKAPMMELNKLMNGLFRSFTEQSRRNQPPKAAEKDPHGGQGAKADPGPRQQGAQQKKKNRKYLDQYCRDLTAKAAEGGIDEVIGRDRELERLTQILCRRQKNNPCLIGEPGVGKTAIAEALALRIVRGQVPYKLADKEVFLVDMTAIVAGTQFRGQFETRMKGLIEEVCALGNIILVIDEVHTIASAGDAEGSMNAANILKPALSRGEIQVIGATTLTEYRKYIEKDSALERRFQPIIVEEPSVEETERILLGVKKYYEDFHRISIPPQTVRTAVRLSERYITDRFLPDKAIDLLDEAAAHLALKSSCIGELEKVQKELKEVQKHKENLEALQETDEGKLQKKYEALAELRTSELNLLGKRDALSDECRKVVLTASDLAEVIEIWTGIPASNITQQEFERIDALEASLKKHLIGQDEAVEAVTRAIKRNRAGVSVKKKPVSFIFAGPTGVGKTELVKRLAEELFHSPETLIRLDMSEFMEKFAVSRIIGSPPGYVGYDDAGQLTEKVRRKPYSVILFDEIEKAHPDVLNILLQILDDGRVTDAHGKVVSFENTVLVMTTNAGSNLSTAPLGFGGDRDKLEKERTNKGLSSFLRPEFLNRVDEIITFRSLDENDFARIASLMLDELKAALSEKGIDFRYTQEAAMKIAKDSFSVKYGARNMRRHIQKTVEDPLAACIIQNYNTGIVTALLDLDEQGEVRVTCV